MPAAPTVVVVRNRDDPLAVTIAAVLREQQVRVREIIPETAGDLSLTLIADEFFVDGDLVGGILFRIRPDTFFGHSFVGADRSFADAEVKAIWLTAMNLPSVVAVNQFDATAWFEGLSWSTWRRQLIKAGVPVAPFTYGNGPESAGKIWYPYNGKSERPVPNILVRRLLGTALADNQLWQSSVVVDGRVAVGDAVPAVLEAARVFRSAGIRLAEIGFDRDGLILSVDVQPAITDAHRLEKVSRLVSGIFYAHMHRR